MNAKGLFIDCKQYDINNVILNSTNIDLNAFLLIILYFNNVDRKTLTHLLKTVMRNIMRNLVRIHISSNGFSACYANFANVLTCL